MLRALGATSLLKVSYLLLLTQTASPDQHPCRKWLLRTADSSRVGWQRAQESPVASPVVSSRQVPPMTKCSSPPLHLIWDPTCPRAWKLFLNLQTPRLVATEGMEGLNLGGQQPSDQTTSLATVPAKPMARQIRWVSNPILTWG